MSSTIKTQGLPLRPEQKDNESMPRCALQTKMQIKVNHVEENYYSSSNKRRAYTL